MLVLVAELIAADDDASNDTPDASVIAEFVAEARTLRGALAAEQVARAKVEGELVGVREALAETRRRAEVAEHAGGTLDALIDQVRKMRSFGTKW